ncbi:MAG: NADH-quinone oxidoreductase subunit L [Candidatus Marinimicrobia bacterium]|nr:NADH-quinone oxidoreductase subunit L [Candidatus Neomarinimicrobiota bacterium]MCF7830254.1 NADH-quinone oxidoreductase subunit L [Candidatus Neomarinimicrobiota bacterium]MCF7882281.1 NADH-quinone oxidoreductase subunit L [Candidatus Neomarinimicrobiota bacterium]
MLDLLWLIPTIPFVSFLILVFMGARMSKKTAAVVGVGSVGISAIIAVGIGLQFMAAPPEGHAFTQTLWTWIGVGNFTPGFSFYLDSLSLLMTLVVTVVGFFIHLYSVEYMADDESYARFFSYMNLFISMMLMLVLGSNLLLLYLGWEGVGLCSYLLIGFWYKDPANGRAARKAFVVTRVGDTAMAIGLFLLFTQLGTLNIQAILGKASLQWTMGSPYAVAAAALLLGGAVGKSAQLPLQTWLPDAMAGPTPVSALIHAATMVTAGVYLIARTNVIFNLAPAVQLVVAIVGVATLLIAGFSALVQRDIKRVLAYSTISQIGYMFLALGVGAYTAAMFHFMTHAFFKALLFLGAGAVILAQHHKQDMFEMGGLKDKLPVTFWTFLAGSAALAAVPLISSGFYSKDAILWYSLTSKGGSVWLWLGGLIGAFITGLYTFRMVFLTFYGKSKTEVDHKPGRAIKIPLIVLGVLALIGGFVEMPHSMGHFAPFGEFLHSALPEVDAFHRSIGTELLFQLIAVVVSLSGIYLAYHMYLKKPETAENLAKVPGAAPVRKFLFSGWKFDWLYDKVFIVPLMWFTRVNKSDFVDLLYQGIAMLSQGFNMLFRQTQTGKVRFYAAGIALGAVITIAIVVFL